VFATPPLKLAVSVTPGHTLVVGVIAIVGCALNDTDAVAEAEHPIPEFVVTVYVRVAAYVLELVNVVLPVFDVGLPDPPPVPLSLQLYVYVVPATPFEIVAVIPAVGHTPVVGVILTLACGANDTTWLAVALHPLLVPLVVTL
jgi:hypothetical protein